MNDSKASIEYLNDLDGIYKIIEEYNPNKKRKILTVSEDIIADMVNNKKLNLVRKLKIFLVFIAQSYFAVRKNIRLNSTHYFIIKIPNKRELEQVVFNHLLDIDFRELLQKMYCKIIFFFSY